MKRFIVFGGDSYYPSGGWRDYRGDFDTFVDALTCAQNGGHDWWHVVDVFTGQQVGKGGLDA